MRWLLSMCKGQMKGFQGSLTGRYDGLEASLGVDDDYDT